MNAPESPSDTCLVTGASSGIGLAICNELLATTTLSVLAVSRGAQSCDALDQLSARFPGRLSALNCDLCSDSHRQALGENIAAGNLVRVINCAGLLHDHDRALWPEKRIEDVTAEGLHSLFSVNAYMPILLARDMLALMPKDRPCLFASLSARVGSIGDNGLGGWYAYRAAKAAQNQLLKTFAIEMGRRRPNLCVLMLHPGTTDTPLSAPFQKNVSKEKLFPAHRVARALLGLMDAATPADSGRFLAWDGQDIPW